MASPKEASPEEQAVAESAKQATEAASKLKLIKVTATRKTPIRTPFAGWSLNEGANAFEGDIPEEVAELYAKLVEQGVITVEILDGEGNATPWPPVTESTDEA